MAYRPILEIVAEEDLFTKESLSFLAEAVEITYCGDVEKYDLKSYYESL